MTIDIGCLSKFQISFKGYQRAKTKWFAIRIASIRGDHQWNLALYQYAECLLVPLHKNMSFSHGIVKWLRVSQVGRTLWHTSVSVENNKNQIQLLLL